MLLRIPQFLMRTTQLVYLLPQRIFIFINLLWILRSYILAEEWEKAISVFSEMERCNIQLDPIACSAIMRAFNKGGNPASVLVVAKLMQERKISFTDAIFYEMVSACSM